MELFLAHGYESTSVDAVLDRADLSKGTFYHHFKSKSELLDAVVAALAQEAARATRDILLDREAHPLDRLNGFLQAVRRWRLENLAGKRQLAQSVFSAENVQLRVRTRELGLDLMTAPFTECIRDGMRQGVFESGEPEAVTRVILLLTQAARDDLMMELVRADRREESLVDSFLARHEAVHRAMEGILGLSRGQLHRSDREYFRHLVSAFFSS
jgi:AcrR family transcriptional regulator